VTEANEDDDCLTSSGFVKVLAPPDLVVTAVTVRNAPLTVSRGGSLTITAAVKNVGEADAAASTTKYLLVNAQGTKNLNGTLAYPLLHSGSSTSRSKVVTFFSDTQPGTYKVRVCADSLDVVAEGSLAAENNNCLDSTTDVTVTVP
jgi:subtilase family serine protease